MSLGQSWKTVAKKWRMGAREYRTQWLNSRRREERYRVLSSNSPSVSVSNELDQVSHEATTLLTLVRQLRRDLDFLLAEGLVSEPGQKMLQHMVKRVENL